MAASTAAIEEEALQKDLRLEKHSENFQTVSRCSSRSRMSKELSELKKLESLLDEKEQILRRKMEILREISDSDSEFRSEQSTEEVKKRTRSWVEHSDIAEPTAEPEAEPQGSLLRTRPVRNCARSSLFTSMPRAEQQFVTPPKIRNFVEPCQTELTQNVDVNVGGETSVAHSNDGNVFVFDKLADALQKSIRSACSQESSRLPSFDGNPKDWLPFKSSYDETTSKFNLSASDNLQRLRLALKGEAKNLVAALLHSCSSPDSVIDALQLRYGNPTKIIKAQIAEIKSSRVIGCDPSDLSVFSAKLSNCVATITALDYGDYLRDTELYESAISKLNIQLRSKFLQYAEANVSRDKCRLLCLADFVRKEAELSQRFIPEYTYPRQANTAPGAQGLKKYAINVTSNVNCQFCNSVDHNVTKCSKFTELSVNDRYDWAKTNKKCFRCLIYSHPGKNCKISKYLHRLLKAPKENNTDENVLDNSNPVLTTNQKLGSLLKVVPVSVRGPKGTVKTYALLDEGASISLIDSQLAEKVGAEGQSKTLNIHGLGSSHQQFSSKLVKVTLENSTGSTFDINIRTMPNLNLHSQFLCKEKLVAYPHIKSMEHNIRWFEEGTPQLILGQDYWPLIVSRRLYAGNFNEPVISDTLLGLVVHGCVGDVHAHTSSVLSHTVIAHVRASDEDELHGLIKESFKLDSLGLEPKSRSDPEIDRSIELLEKNTKKIDSHTWETGLLWEKDNNTFPNSNEKALKRLYSLERSFKKNPELGKRYSLQMNRLFDLKFAEPYDNQERSQVEGQSWVLSHFAALNPNKPNKVRIVVDCADKIQGMSLNDYLLTGPCLLQSLLGVLWRFRRAPIAVAADIKDMFLRIKIKKEDQEFQKFYWREMEDSSPPKLYVMTSMLFGAKCSPSSAIYVKNRNAQDFIEEHPEAVKAIQQNFYCDDYLDSYISEQKAIDMVATVIKIHSQGNFDLCNWASNSESVLQTIPEEKRAYGSIQLACKDSLKERTLGMMWEPSADTLSFNLSMKRVPSDVSSGQVKPTKRQMLAVLMSVFDPIGLLSHFTIRGRILLQEVWRSGITWDSCLLDNEHLKWQQWLSDLQDIKVIAIPRCYVTRPAEDSIIQLHTFCDASSKAYAAACYLRYQYEDEVQVTLVAAKARVTPLKPCSIPRLELQAAVLGAKLAKSVDMEHQLPIQEKFYWTDSITTLAWIRSDPRNYKPFVGHRLAAIDELSSASQWKWVPTSFNPADIATRDSSKLDVSLDGPWFSGPEFLKKREEEWPVEKMKTAPVKEAICEEKHTVNVIQQKEYNLPDITRFSSWQRLINSTAYVFLYIEKLKIKCKKEGTRKLTLELLDKAEKEWIRKTQEEDFRREIACLRRKENLPHDSKILQLSPVLDNDGIMRLGGRIDRTPDVPQELKRPIILSGSSAYTKLLIHHYHKRYNHSSTETVVNEMRQKFWILKLRSTVRSVAHNCQHCKIQRAAAVQPPMGDLPLPRLQHHKRPFTFCGLDYFGPVEVSIGRRREKRWGALFTCLVTRAVHMEIAASLTADSVIMAIRRMSARRGCPTAIYSDNGTNFKAGDVELRKAWSEINKEAISNDILSRGIDWHFIPPTAAHMAGVWERLVQSIKKALKATLHERAPKEEVLATLITEAEQSVNSRPLTFVSVDPRDPEALTPYHFLIGSSSAAPVPGVFDDRDLLLRKQWKVAQRLADMFWSRWLREYLPTLLGRKLKGTTDQDIKEGQLVIIVDNNTPRNVWPRGVITKTFPGQDGKIRVVEVRTVGGVFRRPVNKVIILPVARVDVGNSDAVASVDCLQVFLSRLHEAERRARDGVVVGNTTSYSPT